MIRRQMDKVNATTAHLDSDFYRVSLKTDGIETCSGEQ